MRTEHGIFMHSCINGRSRLSSLARQQFFPLMFPVAKSCIHLSKRSCKHCQSMQSQPNATVATFLHAESYFLSFVEHILDLKPTCSTRICQWFYVHWCIAVSFLYLVPWSIRIEVSTSSQTFCLLTQNSFYTCLPIFQHSEALALHILIRQ